MPSPNVVVVIPWRGGDPGRERAYEVVSARLAGMLPDAVVIAADSGHDRFNRAASRNLGVRLAQSAGADVTVLCDADTIPEPGPLAAAIMGAARDGRLHLPYTRFWGLTEQGARDYLSGRDALECGCDLDYAYSAGGVLVVTPGAWDAVGGMDERFEVWGGEDVALKAAADTLLGPTRRHEGMIVHLWHPPARRTGTPANDAVWELAARYRAADGNPEAMRALVAEREAACRSR